MRNYASLFFLKQVDVLFWFCGGKKRHQMICLSLKVQGEAGELFHKSCLLQLLLLQLLSLVYRGLLRGVSIDSETPQVSSPKLRWGVKDVGRWSQPSLPNLERILTWSQEHGRWCRDGILAGLGAVKTDPCLALLVLPLLPRPLCKHHRAPRHDWYEENWDFCLKPGHMQMNKNSSF